MTSIIIPTYNAEKQVRDLCGALRSQTASSEILVVDSSSSDRTVEIAHSFGARVIVVRREDFDHGGTRALAGKAAEGDILIYMTQDAAPVGDRCIENIMRPFEDPGVAASFGRQLPYPDAGPFGAHLRLFNYPETSYVRSFGDREIYGIKTPFLSNSFAAYRKKALEEIGWFRGKLIMGEDTYAGARLLLAGHKIAYVAEAMVLHSHNYTAMQECRRYFDIGVFHASERWVLEEFGQAEGEGRRYLRSAFAFLRQEGKFHLMPEFIIRNALKYIGYKLGQNFNRLPETVIRRLTMHETYWAG